MTPLSQPQEQRTLVILSALSYRTGELSSYLQEVAQGVSELIGLDWSVVTFCKDNCERILASTIDLGEAANAVYALHGSLTGTVVQTGSPLVVEDALICTDYGVAPEGYQAYLGVPLRTATGEVIGTICSFQRQPRRFTEDDVQLANLFAERAATAIDNYQLYQQQQQFNEMLEAEVVKRTTELWAAQAELMMANSLLEQRVEQRTAELQQAEAKFRALVENANDIIFALTPDYLFSYISPNVTDVLGFHPSEMEGHSFLPFVHPDDVQVCVGTVEHLLATGQKQSGTEYRAPHKQGGWRWLIANVGLSHSTNGQPVIVGVTRDISDRKRTEEALRISETKFSTAFRSSPDAITISTLKDGGYVEVNDSCLRMLGYSHDEMIGRSALDLNVWAKVTERDSMIEQLQRQGQVTNLEVRLRRKSGATFPALFSAGVIHLEDEPCLLAVAADITMLKQAEKALERLAEIGELSAMIVHEVRNPLTTIAMGLNAFKKLQLSDRFQEYLSLSLDEADRLQRLLNQILLYSKPQTLQRSHLELNALIAETVNALRSSPVASGKQLKLVISPEPVYTFGDRDKLKQVVINLVTNGCEAVNPAESITVQIKKQENHQVCIQIHNRGEPIPADVLSKLTKPFFTTKSNGTGLGLAIVQRIVEAHDGDFKIESSAATGTLVTVQLPVTRD